MKLFQIILIGINIYMLNRTTDPSLIALFTLSTLLIIIDMFFIPENK